MPSVTEGSPELTSFSDRVQELKISASSNSAPPVSQAIPLPQPQKMTSTCAKCDKPANAACAGCIEAPSIDGAPIMETYYCSKECQKEHYENHKMVCRTLRARKSLFRAGDLLQKMFYNFRYTVFDKSIVKIIRKVNDGKRSYFLYEGNYPDIVHPHNILVPFPDHLVQDMEEKNAVLCMMACTDAMAFFYRVVEYVLQGISTKIEEATFLVEDGGRMDLKMVGGLKLMQAGAEISPAAIHNAFKIQLKYGKEEYALDLAGAQFGAHCTVMPWEAFCATQVKQLHAILPLGTTRKTFEDGFDMMVIFGAREVGIAVHSVNAFVSQTLQRSVETWQKEKGLKIRDALILSSKQWEEQEKEILEELKQELDFAVKTLKDK